MILTPVRARPTLDASGATAARITLGLSAEHSWANLIHTDYYAATRLNTSNTKCDWLEIPQSSDRFSPDTAIPDSGMGRFGGETRESTADSAGSASTDSPR